MVTFPLSPKEQREYNPLIFSLWPLQPMEEKLFKKLTAGEETVLTLCKCLSHTVDSIPKHGKHEVGTPVTWHLPPEPYPVSHIGGHWHSNIFPLMAKHLISPSKLQLGGGGHQYPRCRIQLPNLSPFCKAGTRDCLPLKRVETMGCFFLWPFSVRGY